MYTGLPKCFKLFCFFLFFIFRNVLPLCSTSRQGIPFMHMPNMSYLFPLDRKWQIRKIFHKTSIRHPFSPL